MNQKSIPLIIVLALFFGGFLLLGTQSAYAESGDEFVFNAASGTITKYNGSEANLTIPQTIGGVTVKAIGQQAFQGNTALLTVNMPATVNSIGSHAFAQCTNLTTINIPTGVTAIANSTFYKCNSLAHINIPDTVISIGDWALADCGSLMSLTFPKSVTSINSTAFNGRSSQLTWYVAEASAAHLYAQKNNINFVLITFPWAELDSILVTLTSEQIASLDAAYSTWSAITPAEMFVLFEDLYTPEVQHRLGINSNAYMALHDIAKIRIYDETNRDSQLNDYVSQYLSSFNSILGTEISHSQLCELIIDEFTKMVALLKDDGFPQNKINSAEALKDFGLSAFNKVIAQEENEGLRTELTALGW